ncbi:hypothetical protein [Nitrospira moscoviensis]|nr:hypothetical protein [Nitrospira moscoviensis]
MARRRAVISAREQPSSSIITGNSGQDALQHLGLADKTRLISTPV